MNRNKQYLHSLNLVIIFCMCMSYSGCSKLKHLDQLLTLKDLSEEGERLNSIVQQQDDNFVKLVSFVKDNKIDDQWQSSDVINQFGDPIFKRSTLHQGQTLTVWLYRKSTEYFNTEKIYLYFNHDQLVDWEHFDSEGRLMQ